MVNLLGQTVSAYSLGIKDSILLGRAIKGGSIRNCEMIREQKCKYICYGFAAGHQKSEDVCERIPQSYYEEYAECLVKVATVKKDSALCRKIKLLPAVKDIILVHYKGPFLLSASSSLHPPQERNSTGIA